MWTPAQIYSFQKELETLKASIKTLKPIQPIKLLHPSKIEKQLEELEKCHFLS
jgi:hypothetical protein